MTIAEPPASPVERACVLYSLLASCRLHGVHPFDYLRDVLLRVSAASAWRQALEAVERQRGRERRRGIATMREHTGKDDQHGGAAALRLQRHRKRRAWR